MIKLERITILRDSSVDKINCYASNLTTLPFPSDWQINEVKMVIECPLGKAEEWIAQNEAFKNLPVTVVDLR